ncbi:MAG: ribonuclease, Rne/Rng family [Acidobacteriaceae bacterium]|nr:ribonuclease, Rne/Rng family [Acidobacteriaceae bacterium]
MTKELFVSSTPHETKVGMVEDDLLAEVYLERENEYTLAGSIYKGRVTRVLPGMQSAFVDIGLERDAFLYVSDFMELEDADELDDIPTNRPVSEQRSHPQPHSEASVGLLESPEHAGEEESHSTEHSQSTADSTDSHEGTGASGRSSEDRGGYRGRRRRRGRRGERFPESKFAKPAVDSLRDASHTEPAEKFEPTERPERSQGIERSGRSERFPRTERPERSNRSDYGPPPGYTPIILPGESISKYQRLAQNQHSSPEPKQSVAIHGSEPLSSPEISKNFPDDEPLFASAGLEQGTHASAMEHENETSHVEEAKREADHRAASDVARFEVASSDWDREQKPLHEANVARVFGEEAGDKESTHTEHGSTGSERERDKEDQKLEAADIAVARESSGSGTQVPPSHLLQAPSIAASAGTLEEEEIEEDEADLAHYVEELEEDAAFEEMEEEVQAADQYRDGVTREITAVGEPVTETTELHVAEPFVIESAGFDEAASEEHVEHEEEEGAESEIEEAQAEAEALLDAEARGNGTVDARVEVRAPANTAAYTQRAPRPGYDRRPQRGGRRHGGGGGRNFRGRRNDQQNVPLISDLLKEGQEVLVQIAKEPIGKKGARITSHIALPGRFLVYMPTVNHTGVSRKISSEEERQRLKRIIISERENGHGGFIVRTAAQGADEEELRADIRFLKGLWNEIKTRAENGKAPALIYHDLNVVERVLRDQVTSDFSAIWVDNEAEYERVLRFANRFQPALVRKVKLYTKDVPLFEQFGLSEEINKALKSKVWLKSGGYIVINQTEALVAIDINTGKYVGKTARLEDTIVKTNVDAIKEIVRQIRLRDLGGIIVIDFIDMDERRNRQKVMQALEEALRADRAPSKVLQFNDFGLVAITRKRVKQSLERTIGSPCPYCESTGFVKSVTTVCNDIYIEMRKMTKHLDHADVMLRVNPEVAKTLKANNGKALLEMEELTKKTIIVKSDPALHQEQFDIN